jgi:eukaryotic-like serine/threonine-protein kinase
MAVPFNLDRLEVTGAPVNVIDGVREFDTGIGAFSCSLAGNCLYIAGGLDGTQGMVVLVDREGAGQPLPLLPQGYIAPRFSPSGDKISLWLGRSKCDVAVYDTARGTLTRLALENDSHNPIWTPDGERITYIAHKSGVPGYELFWKSADGSGAEERLTPNAQKLMPVSSLSWSPDGKVLAFVDRADIWLLPLSGERSPRPFIQSRFNENTPAFSPDGHWLAYVSDESGRAEIYVQPFPGPGGKGSGANNGIDRAVG